MSEITQLDQSVRQLVAVMQQQVRMHRATLPQCYDLPTLEVRWCLGREAVKELLRREISYTGKSGKPVRVHLDDVLRLDELLRVGRDASLRLASAASPERVA